MNHPPNETLAYVAGYFDGEGCIRVQSHKDTSFGIHVFVTNTYKPYLDELQSLFGGKVSLRNCANPKHRTQFQWRISNKTEALVFLKAIYPFLKKKQEQATLGIEFCSLPKYHASRWYVSDSKTKKRKFEIRDTLGKLKKVDHVYS